MMIFLPPEVVREIHEEKVKKALENFKAQELEKFLLEEGKKEEKISSRKRRRRREKERVEV
ncbi:hypothetical protein [Thermotoga sp. KOL6]|uniref:hypothetical protein n=1 Tax=Thermotoga sp. KOL6 TaxID=126741 RepID=UPI000C78E75A|nr:hypothetical protein [Thermotoga sp. KOL6]PLV60431.1 hypothetical protein AS005_03925 [Thermotoga sp. KOL6]